MKHHKRPLAPIVILTCLAGRQAGGKDLPELAERPEANTALTGTCASSGRFFVSLRSTQNDNSSTMLTTGSFWIL